MPDLTPLRLVYVGSCDLQGGKTGELWATEEMANAAMDLASLRKAACPFGKDRRTFNIGGVYEMDAELGEGGKPSAIRRASALWKRTLNTDALAAAHLRERGIEAAEKAKRAEAKARKGGPADDLLDQVARIVAAAPFEMQGKVAAGFAAEVQRRALDIWKKGRRS